MKLANWLKLSAICAIPLFLNGCGGTTAGELTTMVTALSVPTAATSRRGDSRAGSLAGCIAINQYNRVRETVAMARFQGCMFGAMEDNKVITKPATGASNYYKFTKGTKTNKARYKVDASGNTIFSVCVDTTLRSEVKVVKTAAGATATVTDTVHETTFGDILHQMVITATTSGSGYAFASGALNSVGTSFAAGIAVQKGTPNAVKSYNTNLQYITQMYSEFDSSQGTTHVTQTDNGGGSPAGNLINTWTNSTAFTCQTTTAGTYYTSVNSYNFSGLPVPTTPAYLDSWDCAAPSGSAFTTIDASTFTSTLTTAIAACVTTHGSGDAPTDIPCIGMTNCP